MQFDIIDLADLADHRLDDLAALTDVSIILSRLARRATPIAPADVQRLAANASSQLLPLLARATEAVRR